MQSKGAIRFVTICLLIACFWQLSFTLVTSIQNRKSQQRAELAAQKADLAAVAEADRAYYLDSSGRSSPAVTSIPFPARKFILVIHSSRSRTRRSTSASTSRAV